MGRLVPGEQPDRQQPELVRVRRQRGHRFTGWHVPVWRLHLRQDGAALDDHRVAVNDEATGRRAKAEEKVLRRQVTDGHPQPMQPGQCGREIFQQGEPVAVTDRQARTGDIPVGVEQERELGRLLQGPLRLGLEAEVVRRGHDAHDEPADGSVLSLGYGRGPGRVLV